MASEPRGLCCALYDAFLSYIHAENLAPAAGACNPDTCSDDFMFMKHFIDDSNMDATFLKTDGHNALEFDATHEHAKIANLLLFAYIGRHFTDSREETHPLFKYNFATNVLRAVQPHCAFERRVYLSMIVLTVVVLVFVILSRHIPNAWKFWKRAADTTPKNIRKHTEINLHAHAHAGSVGSVGSGSSRGIRAIDFGLRQR